MLEMSILPLVALDLLVQTKVPSYYLSHLSHLFHTQVAIKLTIWSLHKKTITIANTYSQTQCIITNAIVASTLPQPFCKAPCATIRMQGVCASLCEETTKKNFKSFANFCHGINGHG
jgi:hypothetical protein